MGLNNFPTGFDWGDGVTNLPEQPLTDPPGTPGTFGTPSPNSAVLITPSVQPAQEDSDSPEIERAEQATIMHKMKMAWSDGITLIGGIGRGAFLKDFSGNITRVLSSRLKRMTGNQSEFSIVAESISFDSPPDDFQIVPVDLGLDILKNPRYSWCLSPVPNDSTTYVTPPIGDIQIDFVQVKNSIIRMIQAYRDSPFFPSSDQVNGLIQNNIMNQVQNGAIDVTVPIDGYDASIALTAPPRWNGFTDDLPSGNYAYAIVSVPVDLSNPNDPITIALAAAREIISKLWRQEDTPYLTGFQVTLAQYFFAPQFLNPGGYLESPVGVVPDYFMSPSQDGSDTIFDLMAAINPQSYSIDGEPEGVVNISWLRKSDEVEYQRTWFRVVSTWLGSPIGSWDADFYSGLPRPQDANGFDQLV